MGELLKRISDPSVFGYSQYRVLVEYHNERGEIGLYAPIDDAPISKESLIAFLLCDGKVTLFDLYVVGGERAALDDIQRVAQFAGAELSMTG